MATTNDEARDALLIGLGEIPEVGGLCSALVGIFWPSSKEDIWAAIKDDVEKLINQKISDEVYGDVKNWLNGLNTAASSYADLRGLDMSDAANRDEIKEKNSDVRSDFDLAKPFFMREGYELLLLPLMAPMASMHLSIYRDLILQGTAWGYTPESIEVHHQEMRDLINDYSDWAQTWYDKGLQQRPLPLGQKGPQVLPLYNNYSVYVREMTFGVLDYRTFWPAFDPDYNPGGDAANVPKLTRIIYSEAYSQPNDSTFHLQPPPDKPIDAFNIWADGGGIKAVQTRNGGVWGPRLGTSKGGSKKEPDGRLAGISELNPIVSVKGRDGQYLERLKLITQNGTATNWCGKSDSNAGSFQVGPFDDHVLAGIQIMGVNQFYYQAECVIFSFRHVENT